MLGCRRDQSGILRHWAKSLLGPVGLQFGLLCAGTGSCAGVSVCDCSPLRSCTDLHKNLCRRGIWHWPFTPLLCEGQANLSVSSGSSEPVQKSAATFQTQSISLKLPGQKCTQQPAGLIIPHDTALGRGQWEHWVQFHLSQHKKGVNHTEWAQGRGHRGGGGLERVIRRRSWGWWFILTWRRNHWREVSWLPAATYWEAVGKMNPDSYERFTVKGQKAKTQLGRQEITVSY